MGMMNGVRKLLSHHAPMPETVAVETSVRSVARSAPVAAPRPAEDLIDAVEVSGLADAVRSAKISRIVFVGTPAANRRAGVLLARTLVASGASTILIDMGRDGHAAWDMGVIGRAETMRALAASPTVFAEAIHRDHRSRAHVMAALPIGDDAGEALNEATKAVLTALSQAYARTVVVLDEIPFALLGDIVDPNTALVLPRGDDEGEFDSRATLADFGLGEPVTLLLPVPVENTRAA